jgi:NADH-quinone oxidoreductase subunit L
MDHWLEPVFEEASHGVQLAEAHTMHTREWLSTGAAFAAFAIGSYVAYWMYLVQKGKHEVSYLTSATKLAAGFSGIIFVAVGGVILGVAGKDAFSIRMLVPWALVAGGAYLAYHCVKMRAVGLDYVYDRSVVVGVDALADTAASVDQGLVDFVLARLTSLTVAAFGTILRVVQNGVVHVYAAMMVLGLAGLGWFFVQPHAVVTVADSGNGDYVLTAGPGSGYSYRWSPDAAGAPQTPSFHPIDNLKVHLDEGAAKTVRVEVRNAFSSGLDIPVVRWLLPPVAVKEIPLNRPKVEKPVKLELGER